MKAVGVCPPPGEDLEASHWEEINEAVKGCSEIRGLEKGLLAEPCGRLTFRIPEKGVEPAGGPRNGLRDRRCGHS